MRDRTGPLLMLGAVLLFSTGGLLCKLIPWSALAMNGVRNLLAVPVLGLYLLVRRHPLKLNRYTLFGAICYGGVTTLFIAANKLTTAANAIILQYTAPIWIILLMALFFREKPGKRELITVAVVFCGILCFFLDSLSGGSLIGNLVAVLSGIFYAGLFILNSFEEGDTLSAVFLGQIVSGLCLAPLALRETDRSPSVLLAVLLLGVLQVGAAYILFSEATGRTHPVTASLIGAVEPVLNPLLVAVFCGELISPLSLAGALIVLLAVILYNVGAKPA